MRTAQEAPVVPSLVLTPDTARFFYNAGISIPAVTPFDEACALALDYAIEGSERVKAELDANPGLAESFAFSMDFPESRVVRIGNLRPSYRNNVVKVQVLSTAQALGNLCTAVYEQAGAPLSEVTRKPGHEREKSSLGGDVPLRLHQELARERHHTTAREALTEYVLLGCVAPGPHSIPTNVSRIDSALDSLGSDTLAALAQPNYKLDLYDIQKDQGGFAEPQHEPVLVDGLVVSDFDDMHGIDSESQEAFDRLHTAAQAAMVRVPFTPGRLVAVNNRLAWHGRGIIPHTHSPNQEERLLLRAHVN